MNIAESWLQSLQQPVLSVASPFTLRLTLARLIRSSGAAEAAILGGLRSDSPATAFLCGYQCAMRFIDPALEPEQWGAFCVSEKGLTSLSRMDTLYDRANGTLSGLKSHAMLARSVTDWFYIVARDKDSGDLVCVRVPRSADGLEPGPDPVGQSFVPELPHNSLKLSNVAAASGYFVADAHNQLNKPFRYHEDVLAALALSGWMVRQLGGHDHSHASALLALMSAMSGLYSGTDSGYSATTLAMFDQCMALLQDAAGELTGEAAAQWQRDRVLLVMGEKARSVIRSRL